MKRKLLNSELSRLTLNEFAEIEKIPLVVVLDNVRSQHNIGATFRTADAFKIEEIVLTGISAIPPSPEIHKSALGAEFSVKWSYVKDVKDAVDQLALKGYTIISVEQTENSIMLDKFEPIKGQRYALVFGNEVKGVQQDVVNCSNDVIEIPQYGTKHSLNISVSVGVVLWDLVKKIESLG